MCCVAYPTVANELTDKIYGWYVDLDGGTSHIISGARGEHANSFIIVFSDGGEAIGTWTEMSTAVATFVGEVEGDGTWYGHFNGRVIDWCRGTWTTCPHDNAWIRKGSNSISHELLYGQYDDATIAPGDGDKDFIVTTGDGRVSSGTFICPSVVRIEFYEDGTYAAGFDGERMSLVFRLFTGPLDPLQNYWPKTANTITIFTPSALPSDTPTPLPFNTPTPTYPPTQTPSPLPTPSMPPSSSSTNSTSLQCLDPVPENDLVSISCRSDQYIQSIVSADWGRTMGDSCLALSPNLYCTVSVRNLVAANCAGKRVCNFLATNQQFGGIDPCTGFAKQFTAKWTCSSDLFPPSKPLPTRSSYVISAAEYDYAFSNRLFLLTCNNTRLTDDIIQNITSLDYGNGFGCSASAIASEVILANLRARCVSYHSCKVLLYARALGIWDEPCPGSLPLRLLVTALCETV